MEASLRLMGSLLGVSETRMGGSRLVVYSHCLGVFRILASALEISIRSSSSGWVKRSLGE